MSYLVHNPILMELKEAGVVQFLEHENEFATMKQ